MYFLEKITNLSQGNYRMGRVVINRETCTGCRTCVSVCPAQVLELNAEHKSKMKMSGDCISCGACMAGCKSDSIRIANFWNIPSGGYKTTGRNQSAGVEAFPRIFPGE